MEKQKILIVDDSEMNRALLADILEEQYDVAEAENGMEAISILLSLIHISHVHQSHTQEHRNQVTQKLHTPCARIRHHCAVVLRQGQDYGHTGSPHDDPGSYFFHNITPRRYEVANAARKNRMFRRTAALTPRYLISKGIVMNPTVVRVEMNMAI